MLGTDRASVWVKEAIQQMGETPRRSAFRLPWSDGSEAKQGATVPDAQDATATSADTAADEAMTPSDEGGAAQVRSQDSTPEPASPPHAETEPTPFLRELVDAMRGVAEASRDTSLAELRTSVDERVEELRAAAAERAEELRRRSDHDVTAIGEWERSEIERVRAEAEQRRDARRTKLELDLTDHQAASDRNAEATRRRLADYERELAAFFAQLAEIEDPAAFVAAAKRLPPPPDLDRAVGGANGPSTAAAAATAGATGSVNGQRSETTLSERLAQLDRQLAAPKTASAPAPTTDAEPAPPGPDSAPVDEPAPAPAPVAPSDPAVAPSDPAVAPSDPAVAPSAAAQTDALTPIVVKGLGSFGAITSFKQALERVDGVHGVTLSLGPTGEFVYRATHGPQFDIVAAIRQIEGAGAGIERAEGQVLVTIERQR